MIFECKDSEVSLTRKHLSKEFIDFINRIKAFSHESDDKREFVSGIMYYTNCAMCEFIFSFIAEESRDSFVEESHKVLKSLLDIYKDVSNSTDDGLYDKYPFLRGIL